MCGAAIILLSDTNRSVDLHQNKLNLSIESEKSIPGRAY